MNVDIQLPTQHKRCKSNKGTSSGESALGFHRTEKRNRHFDAVFVSFSYITRTFFRFCNTLST